MQRLSLIFALFLLSACAPVLSENVMRQASLNPNLPELTRSPLMNEGKVFVMGGAVIVTKATGEGSLVEAVMLPVNGRGEIRNHDASTGRFLALLPKEKGFLDPTIFSKDRDITVAGIFRGVREQKLGDSIYPYAFFEIVEIRLWEKPRPARYYRDPWLYDPWWPYGPYYWNHPHRWHR